MSKRKRLNLSVTPDICRSFEAVAAVGGYRGACEFIKEFLIAFATWKKIGDDAYSELRGGCEDLAALFRGLDEDLARQAR